MGNSGTPDSQLSQLQQAAIALKQMRAKLEAIEAARTEPIAVIGLSTQAR